jgi:hypothetical protein
VSSLRFGPDPKDLRIVETGAFDQLYPKPDFMIVRFRAVGQWTLGVLRAWQRRNGAWCVQIDAADPNAGAITANWYWFDPHSIDPIGVEPTTGELRIFPPEQRGRRQFRRHDPTLDPRQPKLN